MILFRNTSFASLSTEPNTFSQAADTIISSIKNNIPYKQGSGGYYLLYEI